MNYSATHSRIANLPGGAGQGRPCERWSPCRLACLLILAASLSAHAQFAITELLASNATGLRDEDGGLSDWVEIHNPSASPANLDGWFLTDSASYLAQWRFPATNVPPNGRLVVFASGKSRALAGSNLHASFRLNVGGGYLALVRPGGVMVASAFSYPQQFPDISFGAGFGPALNREALVPAGATMKYRIPTAAINDAWRGGGAYTESSIWTAGTMPAGYDVAPRETSTAYSMPANTAGNQSFGGALGLDFKVTTPVQVTELGCFDDLSDGIASGTTITVKLWQRDDSGTPADPNDDTGIAVLASQTFSDTSPGSLTNGNRFKALSAPLTLTNGAYTIVAYGYNADERNGNSLPVTLNSGGGALGFVGRSRWGNNTAAFPLVVDAGVAQYAAGTLKFQALPNAALPTSLLAMRNANASAYFRIHFSATNGSDYNTLLLNISYDDGFVAWLNGTEIARRNAPGSPVWNSAATNAASVTESIDVSDFISALVPGTNNILAIHGMNVASGDADFRLGASLEGEPRTAANAVFFTTPTPGTTNLAGVLWPRVVINEIHADPPNSKSQPAEFIELYNSLPVAVDLSGWSFTKGITHVFPSRTSIPPRGYLLVAESPAEMQRQFGVGALGPWTGSLANEGETLELADASGAMVDRVSYGLGFPWPTVGDLPGLSMQLLNEGLDHDLGGSWRSALPTPGARNSVTTGIAPPHIRQVNHSPKQPASGQAVTVTARVTDPEGVQSVTLEYQIVEPGNYLRATDAAFATSWVSVPMRDDGLAGDTVAGDSVFTVLLPASVQTHRRLIRYRLVATDSAGSGIRVPYADDLSRNFGYFVYDGVPAWSGAVNPGSTPLDVFDTNVMRQVRAFHLISRNADVISSQYNGAYGDGLYHFEGAVVVDGVVYDHIGYRVAGQNSTYATGKNKWKFRFNRGNWFAFPDDRGRPLGTKRETIKFSGLTEPWAAWNRGLAGLDEALAFRLYNLGGVAAPIAAYAQLRVIDDPVEASATTQYEGDLWGLYVRFEEYDQQFKEEHELPDGNLFLLQGGNNRLGSQGATQPENLSDLNAFTSTSSTGYQAAYQPLSWWRANVNLPGYYTWRAVTEAVNNTDIREQENVAYFRNPTNGLWSIHPWDSDLLYEQFDRWGPEGTQSPAAYEQIRRCLNVPELQVEFQNRVRELQDLLLNSEQIGRLVEEVVGFVTVGGPAQPGFVEADRRLWDYNPRTLVPPRADRAWGNYYRTPFPIPDMGYGPYPQPFYRVLSSPDFAGQVAWVTNFIVSDAHGGARLASLGADPTIPNRPALTGVGPGGFPADGLTFQTSAFSSPGGRAFAAMQWRLGEVYDPTVTNYVQGKPNRYEIQTVWDSGELASFASQVTIPPVFVQQGHTYRARVRHKDAGGRWSHWSAPVQFTAGTAGVSILAQNLIVSELMYDPPASGGVNGDAFEFLELKNVGSVPLDLSGLTFTAGITFAFTNGTMLAPGAPLVLVRDAGNFLARYPGTVVGGIYTGRLDNNGETLTLAHPVGGTVFSFTYGNTAPWPLTAGSLGFSLVPRNSAAAFDMGNAALWRASATAGGSPGSNDSAPAIPMVVINEILTHTDPPQLDSIELFNPHATDAGIGGWFLTDDSAWPKKYRIADGTILPGRGYLVLDETYFSSAAGGTNSFRLNSHGEPIYLLSADTDTNLTGYSHGVIYGAAANGVSFGRYVNSVGEEQFPAQSWLSLGATNSGPRIGQVVINEVLYHPAAGGDEFVELRNITATNVPLFNGLHPANAWKLSGLGYTFPTNLALGPGQFLLLVATDAAAFRAKYSVPGSTQIIGPYSGSLQDGGENLQLQRPDNPDTNGLPYITVDAVRYGDRAPWPAGADGAGLSLQRKNFLAYGNDPINWVADAPSPGADYLPALAPVITSQPADLSVMGGALAILAASASGQPPIGWQWRKGETILSGATSATLTLTNVTRRDSGAYSALATNTFGGALSDSGLLRVRVPQQLGAAILEPEGAMQLLSQDADGGALGESDLGGFSAETSTNLVDWDPFTSALTVTNGQLRLRDANATNYPLRFYRIIER